MESVMAQWGVEYSSVARAGFPGRWTVKVDTCSGGEQMGEASYTEGEQYKLECVCILKEPRRGK